MTTQAAFQRPKQIGSSTPSTRIAAPSSGQIFSTSTKTVAVSSALLAGGVGTGGIAISSSLGMASPLFALIPLTVLLLTLIACSIPSNCNFSMWVERLRSFFNKQPSSSIEMARRPESVATQEASVPVAAFRITGGLPNLVIRKKELEQPTPPNLLRFQDRDRPEPTPEKSWMKQMLEPVTEHSQSSEITPSKAKAVILGSPLEELSQDVSSSLMNLKHVLNSSYEDKKGFLKHLKRIEAQARTIQGVVLLDKQKIALMNLLVSCDLYKSKLEKTRQLQPSYDKGKELARLEQEFGKKIQQIDVLNGLMPERFHPELNQARTSYVDLQKKAKEDPSYPIPKSVQPLHQRANGNRLKSSATKTLGKTVAASRPNGSRSR